MGKKILLTGFEKKVLTVLRKNSLPYDCKIILPPTYGIIHPIKNEGG